MKVSLVATVKDAGPAVGEFLASVRSQTRRPDEVVIVDGGSVDGTLETLRAADDVVLIEEPGANISRGRNLAVRAATHDVIAVSDADCLLSPHWLERIIEPIERGATVVAGAYRPIADTPWQVAASAHIPEPDELVEGWLPSSRSLAFHREAFDAAGGYPEWLDVGEDMYLNHRWVELGVRIEVAPSAVTCWHIRPSVAATWRQYRRYAEGDARAAMYPERHLIRFGAYAVALLVLAGRRRGPKLLLAGAMAARSWKPMVRAHRRLAGRGADRWKATFLVPPMLALTDLAKMWGYARGRIRSNERTGMSG
jgi:glycosyltransferase involved in cell wall biosynthesis